MRVIPTIPFYSKAKAGRLWLEGQSLLFSQLKSWDLEIYITSQKTTYKQRNKMAPIMAFLYRHIIYIFAFPFSPPPLQIFIPWLQWNTYDLLHFRKIQFLGILKIGLWSVWFVPPEEPSELRNSLCFWSVCTGCNTHHQVVTFELKQYIM